MLMLAGKADQYSNIKRTWPELTCAKHVVLVYTGTASSHCVRYVAGKLISRHEDHIMWEESLLLRNLGPFSSVFHDILRPFMGKVFATAGTLIYHFLVWLDLPKEKKLK